MLQCIKKLLIIAPFILVFSINAKPNSFKNTKKDKNSSQIVKKYENKEDVVLPLSMDSQNIDTTLVARRPGSLQKMGKQVNLTRNYSAVVTTKEKADIFNR